MPAEFERFASMQLHSRVQKLLETVQDFASVIRRLVRKAYLDLSEKSTALLELHSFVNGLSPKYRKELILQDPKNFKEAVKKEMQLEALGSLNVEAQTTASAPEIVPVASVTSNSKNVKTDTYALEELRKLISLVNFQQVETAAECSRIEDVQREIEMSVKELRKQINEFENQRTS